MKNEIKLRGLIVIVILFFTISLKSQNSSNIWAQASSINNLPDRIYTPNDELYFNLDFENLKQILANAPDRKLANGVSNVIINFPTSKGDFEDFKIFEASVLDSELQSTHSELASYIGKSIKNPNKTIRLSTSNVGMKAIIIGGNEGTEYIEPTYYSSNVYTVFLRSNLPSEIDSFECLFDDSVANQIQNDDNVLSRNANDGQLREFRLALGCTQEYAAYHVAQAGLQAGTDNQKKAAVLAEMNDVMTRVNAVYENDLSITMILVPTNTNVIFLTDTFLTNNNLGALIDESQQFIDAFVGSNYDIGHMLCTGPGGLAQLFSPCTNNKARGVTGSTIPAGVGFEGILMHEMGHQYGSLHTFNGNTSSCLNNRSASAAYEVGSGTTIMAYPGICGVQNVQTNRDLYFHQKSLESMWSNITMGNSTCANLIPTNNAAPIAEAGLSYTIPIGTPYKLTGSSTDLDGIDTHTYVWEQYDLGPAGIPSPTDPLGPLVRSVLPSASPIRYMPRLQDVLVNGGNSTQWEVLSFIARPINYKLTVRDNDVVGGQIGVDETVVNTVASGFFRVTSQNTSNIVYDGNSTQTVTWDVAGTTGFGINTTQVNILLSTDGGLTFDNVLASGTPNDGSESVIMPNVDAAQCRIIVEAVGNIFYNVNLNNFQIQEQLSLDDFDMANNLKIYPNPSKGTFNVSFNSQSSKAIMINVYDIRGREIIKLNFQSSVRFEETINLENLESGIYMLEISDGLQKTVKKIVLQ